jgi:two-component system heavy metal sensor histidine kinase CusS
MRAIRAKVAVWSALSTAGILAVLLYACFFLLKSSLINDLDKLNIAQFEQISSKLERVSSVLDAPYIEQRMRDTGEYAGTIFYIEIWDRYGEILFSSPNVKQEFMGGRELDGKETFNHPYLGDIRVGVFNAGVYTIIIGTPEGSVEIALDDFRKIAIVLSIAMMLMSGLIGYQLSELTLRPIVAIQNTAKKITLNNLKERIPASISSTEMNNLVQLLNGMFDRIEASFDQIRRFTGEASHELKTPLSIIRLHSEKLFSSDDVGEQSKQILHEQLIEIDRLTRVIEELLFISRAESGNMSLNLEKISPKIFFESFLYDAQILTESHGNKLKMTHSGDGEIEFEPKLIRQILFNLLMNAINASPLGGEILISSTLNMKEWRVNVVDQGPGLDEVNLERIFERFVRIKSDKNTKGTGLGLSICQSLIQLHHGKIVARNNTNRPGLNVEIIIYQNST